MAVTTVDFGTATTVLNAVSATGSAPSSSTDGYKLRSLAGTGVRGSAPVLRTYIDYTGTVSGTLRIYFRKGSGAWFRGDSFAMTGTDESVDWAVGEGKEFTFVVEAISGGGSLSLYAEGAL